MIGGFWSQAIALQGSVTPKVVPRMLFFAAFAAGVKYLHDLDPAVALGVGPLEFSGAVLGVLLVLRINAGYDRWWEARKLWGGIVNQSRNLVISALAYGPAEAAWRSRFARWVAAFAYVSRSSLRGERKVAELAGLVGRHESEGIEASQHMPSYVAYRLAQELRAAREADELGGFEFTRVDDQRAQLIDHIGALERILKTPIPRVCAIKVRRFIVLFLLILPFALAGRVEWLTPLIQAFVAYPLLSLDQIGEELQNPFSRDNLSHLPLDDIAATIHGNLLGLERIEEAIVGKQGIEVVHRA